MTIVAIVMISQCLLLIADEKRLLVYIRIALLLVLYNYLLQIVVNIT